MGSKAIDLNCVVLNSNCRPTPSPFSISPRPYVELISGTELNPSNWELINLLVSPKVHRRLEVTWEEIFRQRRFDSRVGQIFTEILWEFVLGVGLLALSLNSLSLVHIPQFTTRLVKGPLTQDNSSAVEYLLVLKLIGLDIEDASFATDQTERHLKVGNTCYESYDSSAKRHLLAEKLGGIKRSSERSSKYKQVLINSWVHSDTWTKSNNEKKIDRRNNGEKRMKYTVPATRAHPSIYNPPGQEASDIGGGNFAFGTFPLSKEVKPTLVGDLIDLEVLYEFVDKYSESS
ncbi:Uncharacterized protein Fot_41212 [Forsythia ovata]|uniref:Uncharacterized protein n=1 Tax=Forsythia ovata TaxID=205694 RepID=A0ABD1RHN0_9LAMI